MISSGSHLKVMWEHFRHSWRFNLLCAVQLSLLDLWQMLRRLIILLHWRLPIWVDHVCGKSTEVRLQVVGLLVPGFFKHKLRSVILLGSKQNFIMLPYIRLEVLTRISLFDE